MRIDLPEIQALPWFSKEKYPFVPKEASLPTGTMSYLDEGTGRPLLFIHGTPSWNFEWVPLIQSLKATRRCLAPDHLGFGLSSRPNSDYSLAWHLKNFSDWAKQLNLETFDVITHDFGSLIAFPYLAANANRIGKIAVLNSWLWPLEKYDPFFRLQKPFAGSFIMKHLYLNWNLSARKMVPLSWGKNRAALQEYHPYFVELFPEPELRRSTWAVADILTHKAREIQSVWEGSSALKTKPLALIWGDQDGFVSKKHRRGWKENFSVQQEFILENAGHFPQLESPQEVAAALGLFLDA